MTIRIGEIVIQAEVIEDRHMPESRLPSVSTPQSNTNALIDQIVRRVLERLRDEWEMRS